ncbi:MAG: hypothetical protein R2849_14590 [Thermomicrobiales bacterium]
MFAAVFLSWMTVPISVFFISRFSNRLNTWDDELAELAEEPSVAASELVHR